RSRRPADVRPSGVSIRYSPNPRGALLSLDFGFPSRGRPILALSAAFAPVVLAIALLSLRAPNANWAGSPLRSQSSPPASARNLRLRSTRSAHGPWRRRPDGTRSAPRGGRRLSESTRSAHGAWRRRPDGTRSDLGAQRRLLEGTQSAPGAWRRRPDGTRSAPGSQNDFSES